MTSISKELAPRLDEIGRWYWPDPDCECVRMMRAGSFRLFLLFGWKSRFQRWWTFLMMSFIKLKTQTLRKERLDRFRQSAFTSC